MPAIGNTQAFQKVAPARVAVPALPKTAPPSHTDITSSGNAYGASRVSAYNKAVAKQPPTSTDITSSGAGYGSAQANAFKQAPAYHQAVVSVFKAQPSQRQQAILKNAKANPSTPESQAVLNYLKGFHVSGGGVLTPGMVAPAMGGGLGAVGKIISPILTPVLSTIGKLIVNTGTDAYQMPASTVEGLYGLGSDVAQGKFGNAFHSLIDPYIYLGDQLIHGNFSGAMAHPLNTAMMLAGPEAAAGRLAGSIARSGALGSDVAAATSIARAPLSLGTIAGEASPIMEHRYYSANLFTQGLQKGREGYLRSRGQDPNIARPAPKLMPKSMQYALNVGRDAKLMRRADEMTSVRQQAGRYERTVALSDWKRIGKQFSPEGRAVTSHVLQGVIKTPQTAVDDVMKEINRLKVAQADLKPRSLDMLYNRRQVKALDKAVHTPLVNHPAPVTGAGTIPLPKALSEAFQAAKKMRPLIKGQDAYLLQHGLLDPAQALRATLFPYAQAHMGARYNPATDSLEVPGSQVVNGVRYGRTRPVTTQEILDHIKANGVPDPAYVGHFPGKVAPYRFYSAYKMARGTLGKGRTGLAFEKGGYDHSWEGLGGQIASRAEALTRASLQDRVVNELGVVPGRDVFKRAGVKYSGGDMTYSEAEAVRRAAMVDDHGNPIPNATELVPIPRASAGALHLVGDLQHPAQLANLSDLETQSLANAIRDAKNSTSRNIVLVPRVAAERFAQQFQSQDGLLRSVGRVTQQFRRTVLPYSTHWMAQIGSEAVLRAMLGGVFSPHYLADGRRLMKLLQETPEGRAALMEMVNATFYNKRDPLMIHNPNQNMVSSFAHAAPVTRQLIAAHNLYADSIGQAMYTIEHNARLMGLGKMAHREVSSWGKAWQNTVRIQGDNLATLADKLKADPTLVSHFGREIDNLFGKYNKFTPTQRAMIQSATPFLPWYLSAAKFVLWHLPKDHPVSSALLASLRQTINQDIQDGKGAPLNTYAMQELARITPFGIFTPPNTTPSLGGAFKGQQMTNALFPELQGALYNFAGLNSFGQGPLTTTPDKSATYGSDAYKGDVPPGSKAAVIAGLNNLLEGFLPAARYGREAREGGGPAYGVSNIISPKPKPGNPGSSEAAANRMFNPFYSFEASQKSKSAPKYESAKAQAADKASSSSGGWNFSGGSSGSSSSGGWNFGGSSGSSASGSGWNFGG